MNDNKNLYQFPKISKYGINWQNAELARREYESKAIKLPAEVWKTMEQERSSTKSA